MFPARTLSYSQSFSSSARTTASKKSSGAKQTNHNNRKQEDALAELAQADDTGLFCMTNKTSNGNDVDQEVDTFPLPLDFEPSDFDIICGRGRGNYNASGNVRFRSFVRESVSLYVTQTTKTAKSNVLANIAIQVREGCHDECRFIKLQPDGSWVQLGENAIREKVGHAMREAQKAVRRVPKMKTLKINRRENNKKDEDAEERRRTPPQAPLRLPNQQDPQALLHLPTVPDCSPLPLAGDCIMPNSSNENFTSSSWSSSVRCCPPPFSCVPSSSTQINSSNGDFEFESSDSGSEQSLGMAGSMVSVPEICLTRGEEQNGGGAVPVAQQLDYFSLYSSSPARKRMRAGTTALHHQQPYEQQNEHFLLPPAGTNETFHSTCSSMMTAQPTTTTTWMFNKLQRQQEELNSILSLLEPLETIDHAQEQGGEERLLPELQISRSIPTSNGSRALVMPHNSCSSFDAPCDSWLHSSC